MLIIFPTTTHRVQKQQASKFEAQAFSPTPGLASPGSSPAHSAIQHLLPRARATALHGQVVWPGSAAARLTGPAQAPRVYEQRGLVHLHRGAGSRDGPCPRQLHLALHIPLAAACPAQAGAAAAVGRGNGQHSRGWE